MPEQSPYPNESKEDYKERIKKLKAKTSKMRLAGVIGKHTNVIGSKDRSDALKKIQDDFTRDYPELAKIRKKKYGVDTDYGVDRTGVDGY
tara:strand:+ start:101 stop:370 length:270 start_codon:yes stop_codon:yes gene_type:complete